MAFDEAWLWPLGLWLLTNLSSTAAPEPPLADHDSWLLHPPPPPPPPLSTTRFSLRFSVGPECRRRRPSSPLWLYFVLGALLGCALVMIFRDLHQP